MITNRSFFVPSDWLGEEFLTDKDNTVSADKTKCL